MEIDKKRGGLLVVISVLTLIVAIIGASFAYFTATINGTQNGVNVTSTSLAIEIEYPNGRSIAASDLIPASEEVVTGAYTIVSDSKNSAGKSKCVDSNDKKVCSVYSFSVKNSSNVNQDITASILTSLNGFVASTAQSSDTGNLKYIVYDVTSGTPVRLQESSQNYTIALPKSGTTGIFGSSLNTTATVNANSTNTYDIVIFLNETGSSQDSDQGKNYVGTISVSIAGASNGQITGKMQ